MPNRIIKNFEQIATNENRKLILSVAEAGLKAINTENAIINNIVLEGDNLVIQGQTFALPNYKRIKVVGFGKSSMDAALALYKILGSRISAGVVVGLTTKDCGPIKTFAGSHPKPSPANMEAGEQIYHLLEDSTQEDLILVLASGGGSALLCYGAEELEQGTRLYDAFLGAGRTISEMNTVRKHISLLKGGGLAKLAYPATVIGLIFSDVPGNNFEDVASGATYKDETTVADAEKIIKDNNLGEYKLIETPKEDKYFENVHNFVLVSNKTAVDAMSTFGDSLGLKVKVVSTELYLEASAALHTIASQAAAGTLVLAAGEPSVKVGVGHGRGGRNLHLSLLALTAGQLGPDSVFLSLASDGLDNSDMAGGLADQGTISKARALGINGQMYLDNFDSYSFFEQTGDLVETGPTGANVSDLMILITKK